MEVLGLTLGSPKYDLKLFVLLSLLMLERQLQLLYLQNQCLASQHKLSYTGSLPQARCRIQGGREQAAFLQVLREIGVLFGRCRLNKALPNNYCHPPRDQKQGLGHGDDQASKRHRH